MSLIIFSDALSSGDLNTSAATKKMRQKVTKSGRNSKPWRSQSDGRTTASPATVDSTVAVVTPRFAPNAPIVSLPIDKHDSLIFFPSAFTRCANGSDTEATAKLFGRHLDQDCIFFMNHVNCTGWTSKDFLRFTQLADVLEPDRVMSVRSTRVAKNQVFATLYSKYTDSQLLYDCVSGAKKDPSQRAAACCSADRTERLLLHQNTNPLPANEKKQLQYFSRTRQDLVVHATIDMVLTFNANDKIVAMEFSGRLTSAKPAAPHGRVCTF